MSIQALKKFSTCEIADAMLKLGQRPWGGYIPDIHMWSPTFCQGDTRIIGPAFTVKLVKKEDTAPSLQGHFVDLATPGSVVVVSAPPDVKNACWGGLMSAGAMAKQCPGAIIDGRVRDLAEQRAMQFPIFAKSHSILPQGAFVRASEVQVPVTFEGSSVVIHPGDIMVADLDGVVCVPVDLVDQVVESCEKYTAIDNQCMEAIQLGHGVKESFDKYRGK
ncbi:RraA-like protein [Hesseltinella vesiculosa]|uniref:RraA-like protein n=1 Tax=Hesseltinella vesiculosa TaxID=101127 RepID=A0A1X2GNL2_9FUNG|nr:RraA-like protein [Hesseltinella vesiculosa]